MKVLLFSDLHYSLDRTKHGRDPAASLRRAITHANTFHGDAALCVVLGDLTDRGSEAEYGALAADLKTLSVPCRAVLGNHDNRDNFLRVFGTGFVDENGFVQSTADVGRYRFLLLDTHMPGEGWGSLDGGRLEWLDGALAEADRPCLVCLHHPPLPTALPAFDAIGLRGADRFAAVLERHRSRVCQVFFGHCHMSVAGNLAGVPVCGVKSLLYQALPNFDDDRFLDAPGLTSAYSVAVVDERHVTVHVIEFEYSGAVVESGEEP